MFDTPMAISNLVDGVRRAYRLVGFRRPINAAITAQTTGIFELIPRRVINGRCRLLAACSGRGGVEGRVG